MPDFRPIIREAFTEILRRDADSSGLAAFNRQMNQGLSESLMRESLIRSAEYAANNPIVRVVRVSGGSLLVDTEPLRQFTLFAAGLRDEGTLAALFRQGRALGYNCARVGSETADWDTEPSARAQGERSESRSERGGGAPRTDRRDTTPGGGKPDILDGLRGPEPGSPAQIENLERVVHVAAQEGMALEVCASFTIKERPFNEQLAHVERTADQLADRPHVFFTAVNEPWVNSNVSTRQVDRMLRSLLSIAPERLRGVDEDGFQSPEFRYDATICDFIAYHWPRDPGWEQAPGVEEAVRRWQKPVFLNETQCFQSDAEVEEYGDLPLCETNQEGFVQMMDAIYGPGGFGCYHSLWGLRSEEFGFAPDVRGLGRTASTQAKLRLLAAR